MLDGSRAVYDRGAMSEIQIQIAQRRLILGITNVGFWVAASIACLAWISILPEGSINHLRLFKIVLGTLTIQSVFDFVGGAVLIPPPRAAYPQFFRIWSRGMLVHSALLCGTGFLSYYSYQLANGFYLSVTAASLCLFFFRRQILYWVSGARTRPAPFGGSLGWEVDSSDPSFTGGTTGIGPWAMFLLPASWKTKLTAEQSQTVIDRRLWEIRNNLPARSLLISLSWNLAGCKIGAVLLGLSGRPVEEAIIMQSSWMTLWGFLALLLLPSFSRSSVFGADRAALAHGRDARDWIKKFPSLTGEDGNSKTVIQRVFYPIPSSVERLQSIENPRPTVALGNIARSNLFLSLATLTILGRCVHCNVGRPELWIFPPSD